MNRSLAVGWQILAAAEALAGAGLLFMGAIPLVGGIATLLTDRDPVAGALFGIGAAATVPLGAALLLAAVGTLRRWRHWGLLHLAPIAVVAALILILVSS